MSVEGNNIMAEIMVEQSTLKLFKENSIDVNVALKKYFNAASILKESPIEQPISRNPQHP
jgi:hypothetical protein